MCKTPSYIPSAAAMVACRNCWQCRANRVNDLVGRCIAEQEASDETLALTLTYAGDVPNAATLIYPDVQKFIKSLRKAGYSVRYIVAGEYGTKKGRAHWHIVLFFKGAAPELPLEQRASFQYWPHGWVYTQKPDYRGFHYLLKYALKDQDASTSVGHLAMSKKPPLGYEYFINLARRYVDQDLSPQSPEYKFRGITKPNGRLRAFWLQGRMREMFVAEFLVKYRAERGKEYPFSDFVQETEDSLLRQGYYLPLPEWEELLDAKTFREGRALAEKIEAARPHLPELPGESPETMQEERALAYIIIQHDDLLLTVYDDGSMELCTKDNEKWLLENAKQVAGALRELGVPQNQATDALTKARRRYLDARAGLALKPA